MGCCASVVRVAPDGADYEEQDVYINLSEYDEDNVSCKVQMGEVTYSKADSDGVVGNESTGMTGVRKRFIVAQAFVMHGINGDPNQYTAEALKESPRLTRKELTRVLQWVDDTLQCALYQHIANNPKKSHVTLRGIANSAKFKNRTHIYTESAESCGITDGSNTSVPEIALNATNSSVPPIVRPQHLSIPVNEETKSAASSNASKVKSDSNFSSRTGKGHLGDSPMLSPDERTRQRAFDVRFAFAPNLTKTINMDAALLALNQHCQAVQLAKESGSQNLLSSTVGSNSRLEGEAAKAGLPSFRSVSEYSATKLVDIRELCLRFNLPEDSATRPARVGAHNVTVDCSLGELQLKDFGDDLTKQLQILADRSDSVASPSVSGNRDDSVRTNEKGDYGSGVSPLGDGKDKRTSRKPGSAPHVLEVPVPTGAVPAPHPYYPHSPLGHRFSSPTDSALSWKERTLTFDALKTFVKYQTFLLKQKRADEIEFDRRIHCFPPSIRTLVFGPYPYSAHLIRPGLIPPSAPLTGTSRAALQKNITEQPARKSLQPQPHSGSESEKDE